MLVIALFFIGFYQNVRRTVRLLVGHSEKMAQGDLSYRRSLDTKDELLTVSTAQIADVSASTQQLTAGTEEVTASIQEVNGSAEASAAASKKVAETAKGQLSSTESVLSASKSLSALAERLTGELGKFHL